MTEPMTDDLKPCRYASGLMCNQQESICNQGTFESHCLMNAIRQMSFNSDINIESFKKQTITDTVLFLFDRGYIRWKFFNLPPYKVIDRVMSHLKDQVTQEWIKRCAEGMPKSSVPAIEGEQPDKEAELAEMNRDREIILLMGIEFLNTHKPNDSFFKELEIKPEELKRIEHATMEELGW